MPYADTTYASIDEWKTRVGIPAAIEGDDPEADTTDQDLGQQYLNAAAYIVDHVTRRPPRGTEAYSATGTTEDPVTRLFDDTGSGTIPIDDLLELTGITRGETDVTIDQYILKPYNEYPKTQLTITGAVYPSVYAGYVRPYYNYGMGQIAVSGVWGFCYNEDDRPPVIKEAVLTQAARMYERMGLKAKDLANAIRDPWKAIDPLVLAMLAAANLCREDRDPEREITI